MQRSQKKITFLSRLGLSAAVLLGISVCAQSPSPAAPSQPNAPAAAAPTPVQAPSTPVALPPQGAPLSFAPLVDSVKNAVVNVSV
jgi:S1-C subfamily serine protease